MMENLLNAYGEGPVLFAIGAGVGLFFGAAAQHSRFCLRAATVEVADGHPGWRLSIWLVAFFAAVFAVQLAILLDWLRVDDARQLANVGSLSGAIIGGLMFGCGMILARGCASRLLVLSATGNLRAFVTGLVLTLVAQASLSGFLAPAREALAALWQVPGGSSRHILSSLGISTSVAVVMGAVALAGSIFFAIRSGARPSRTVAGLVVGFSVAAGWIGTFAVAQSSFEVVAITSITFTGPSADTLMGLVNARDIPFGFGIGLVPGVFIGAGAAALLSGEAKIQRFDADTPMEQYLVGAVLMGFGSMLAGGCAVGAGMSGGSIFALTAWVAVFCMWIGAMMTHVLMRGRARAVPA